MAEEVLRLEANEATIDELLPLIKGKRGLELLESGDINAGTLACGQVIGLIDDIPSVREIIENTVKEAVAALKKIPV